MRKSLPFFFAILLASVTLHAKEKLKPRSPKEWKEDLIVAIQKAAELKGGNFSANDQYRVRASLKSASEDLEDLSQSVPSSLLTRLLMEEPMWGVAIKKNSKRTTKHEKPVSIDDQLALISADTTKKVLSKNKSTTIRTPRQLLDFLFFTDTDKNCDQTMFERFKTNFHTQDEKTCFFDWAFFSNIQEETYYRVYLRDLLKEVWRKNGSQKDKELFLKNGIAYLIGHSFGMNPSSVDHKVTYSEYKTREDCSKTRFRTHERASVLMGFNDCVTSLSSTLRFMQDVGFQYE